MDTNKTLNSAQLAEGYRRYPIDDHGKLRMQYANVPALTGALAIGNTIGLLWLPPGRKRLLLNLSRLTTSAFGAGATLSIGHDEYMSRPPANAAVAADPTAFVNALSVAAAVTAQPVSTVLKYDIYSTAEVLVYATIGGAAMPIGATLELELAYLYE